MHTHTHIQSHPPHTPHTSPAAGTWQLSVFTRPHPFVRNCERDIEARSVVDLKPAIELLLPSKYIANPRKFPLE